MKTQQQRPELFHRETHAGHAVPVLETNHARKIAGTDTGVTRAVGEIHVPFEATQGVHVPAGKDRFQEDELLIWGVIPLSTKVSTKDTGGRLYMFEHANMGKGGPPRHVHHDQDEWFYAIKGEFLLEVGDEEFRLKPGDSLFAPRQVPHAWAHISDEPGTLLTAVSPAGTFETFIRDAAELTELPTPEEVGKAFAAHGMTVVGPPLKVE